MDRPVIQRTKSSKKCHFSRARKHRSTFTASQPASSLEISQTWFILQQQLLLRTSAYFLVNDLQTADHLKKNYLVRFFLAYVSDDFKMNKIISKEKILYIFFSSCS